MDHDLNCNTSEHTYDENENENENFQVEVENSNQKTGDALLISLVRDHPYIYNKKLSDFKDNIKRENTWQEIGRILDMTADECQSRWTRLRERYSREKKMNQQETTTGASKRKIFKFFEDMQFLDPFVKRRRTMNEYVKSTPSSKRFNLQRKSDSRGGKENNFSSAIVCTLSEQSSKNNNVNSKQNQLKVNSYSKNEINLSSANAVTFNGLIVQQPVTRDINPVHLKKIGSRDGRKSKSHSVTAISILEQSSKGNNVISDNRFKQNGNEINTSSENPIILVQRSVTHDADLTPLKDSTLDIHSMVSDTSTSVLSDSDYMKKEDLTGQQIKSKENSEADFLQNAICKITSLLENKYSSSSSSLKPEIEEDVAFCQLILSLLTKMPQHKNIQKKKEILRIIYDM